MDTTIGIPRALLYYKYGALWKTFFEKLGFKVLLSPETNTEILENGKSLINDESCLSMKIYMGHVSYLINKCDYILVPRIKCLNDNERVCTNFNALYDIVNNVFDTKILNYNIDVSIKETEKKAFMKMGKYLGKNKKDVIKAYMSAKAEEFKEKREKYRKQLDMIKSSKRIKVLLVSHPYNTYDRLIGYKIIKILNELNIDIVYADLYSEDVEDKYKYISKSVYWTYSKKLLSSIIFYLNKVNGILLLTAFPCGPDSLTNEMCLRRLNIPMINIVVDELSADAGLQTRIESFIDIINSKGKVHNE